MSALKRILVLILSLCTIFAFASCDMVVDYVEQFLPIEDNEANDDKTPTEDNNDTTPDGTTPDGTTPEGNDPDDNGTIGGGITSDDWDAAIEQENFSNVTFSILVNMPDEDEPYPILCKLDGSKVAYSEGEYPEEIADEETAEGIRNIYINTVLSIVENVENFTFDATTGTFVGKGDIVYSVQVFGYDAKITTSNTVVKIDTDKNIAEISCHMKQDYVEDGRDYTLEFDAVFSFYNYGTTVIPTDGVNVEGTLHAAYENSCKYSNVSIYAEALEELNDGTSILEYPVFKSTATALYVSTGSNTVYYSIENGKTYMFRNTGAGWEKHEMSNHSLIGALVQMYVGQFESIFDSMVYDADSNVYYAENVEVAGSVFDYVSIELTRNGLIHELKYVMDTYSYETGTPVVHGKGYATMTFCDYGTTVVELPTVYADDTN